MALSPNKSTMIHHQIHLLYSFQTDSTSTLMFSSRTENNCLILYQCTGEGHFFFFYKKYMYADCWLTSQKGINPQLHLKMFCCYPPSYRSMCFTTSKGLNWLALSYQFSFSMLRCMNVLLAWCIGCVKQVWRQLVILQRWLWMWIPAFFTQICEFCLHLVATEVAEIVVRNDEVAFYSKKKKC